MLLAPETAQHSTSRQTEGKGERVQQVKWHSLHWHDNAADKIDMNISGRRSNSRIATRSLLRNTLFDTNTIPLHRLQLRSRLSRVHLTHTPPLIHNFSLHFSFFCTCLSAAQIQSDVSKTRRAQCDKNLSADVDASFKKKLLSRRRVDEGRVMLPSDAYVMYAVRAKWFVLPLSTANLHNCNVVCYSFWVVCINIHFCMLALATAPVHLRVPLPTAATSARERLETQTFELSARRYWGRSTSKSSSPVLSSRQLYPPLQRIVKLMKTPSRSCRLNEWAPLVHSPLKRASNVKV